mmetsp:Transcript_5624/g.14415  ORF Transcript_5624/g.14415 Transcript_5624/m.14415 type:complete len:243 (+) Transcript_5624:138-866(+)
MGRGSDWGSCRVRRARGGGPAGRCGGGAWRQRGDVACRQGLLVQLRCQSYAVLSELDLQGVGPYRHQWRVLLVQPRRTHQAAPAVIVPAGSIAERGAGVLHPVDGGGGQVAGLRLGHQLRLPEVFRPSHLLLVHDDHERVVGGAGLGAVRLLRLGCLLGPLGRRLIVRARARHVGVPLGQAWPRIGDRGGALLRGRFRFRLGLGCLGLGRLGRLLRSGHRHQLLLRRRVLRVLVEQLLDLLR